VFAVNDAGSEQPANLISIDDTGADLIWTPCAAIDNGQDVDFAAGIRAFWAVGNGSSCTITASKTGANAGRWYIRPYSWTGANTSSPIGGVMGYYPNVSDGAVSGTLSATPAVDSEVVSVMASVLNGANPVSVTQGADQTELFDVQSDDYALFHGQVRGSSVSTAIAWADVNDTDVSLYRNPVFLAVEIKAAGTAFSAPPPRSCRSAIHFLL
jgi:hypothetical protein